MGIVSEFVKLRTRWQSRPYGDQGLFVKSSVFAEARMLLYCSVSPFLSLVVVTSYNLQGALRAQVELGSQRLNEFTTSTLHIHIPHTSVLQTVEEGQTAPEKEIK